jgi:hypothetical protein
VFSPIDVGQQDVDVLFYGHGREYRSEWMDAMLAKPSHALPDARFAARGTKLGDIGRTATAPVFVVSANCVSMLAEARLTCASLALPMPPCPVRHPRACLVVGDGVLCGGKPV